MARIPRGELTRTIKTFLADHPDGAGLREIYQAVHQRLGETIYPQSIRSVILNNTAPRGHAYYERVGKGIYRLRRG